MRFIYEKKLILVLLMAELFLVGCGNNTETLTDDKQNYKLNTNQVSSMENIEFTEIELLDIDWDKIEFPVNSREIEIPANVKSISTREDALCIGTAIIENCRSNHKFSDYVLVATVHSTSDNIWCFDYSIDQHDKDVNDLIDCGGFHVAIDGS